MYLLLSKFRFLEFRLLLSRVSPYLQFFSTNCLIQDKHIKVISAMYENKTAAVAFGRILFYPHMDHFDKLCAKERQ